MAKIRMESVVPFSSSAVELKRRIVRKYVQELESGLKMNEEIAKNINNAERIWKKKTGISKSSLKF